MRVRILSLLVWAGLLMGAGPALADAPREAGENAPDRQLDFWLGDWEVRDAVTGELAGLSRIEAVLHGAAVIMHWRDTDGAETKEWFYYHRAEGHWKQIVVNEQGQAKIRAQTGPRTDDSLLFRGSIPLRDGGAVLDESAVGVHSDGRVRQVIRQSRDNGVTWQTVFDAYYVRRAPLPRSISP